MIHPDVVRYGTQVPMRQYVLAPLCLINARGIGARKLLQLRRGGYYWTVTAELGVMRKTVPKPYPILIPHGSAVLPRLGSRQPSGKSIPESPSASVSFQPASGLWKLASSTYENLPGASGRQFQV